MLFQRAIFRSFCRDLRRMLFASVVLMFAGVGVANATATFSVTTTNLSAGDTFQFKISAAGTFYVDCGTDGTLSGEGNAAATVSGDTITKSDTSDYTYTCSYTSGGAKIVQFGGVATGYSSGNAAIKFSISSSPNDTNVKKIASISGSLGQIFGTIQNPATGSGQPVFSMTFYGASNMTGTNIDDPNNLGMKYALPPTLFDGISGAPAEYMLWLQWVDRLNPGWVIW